MSYYKSNAIYEEIERLGFKQFLVPAGNSWFLIYGDSRCNPVVIVFVFGYSVLGNTEYLERASFVLSTISLKSGIPYLKISFDDSIREINSVNLESRSGIGEITLSELKDIFFELGLPVKQGLCQKAINDASSSAYHNWQRQNLGQIVVADMDLFRLNDHGFPEEIIELKRSYIPLNNWTPFRQDYANFNLLTKVTYRCSCLFHILYNLRTKTPWFDDPSIITLFSYSESLGANKLGQYTFQQFVDGDYF